MVRWNERSVYYRIGIYSSMERLVRRVNWITLVVLMGVWYFFGWKAMAVTVAGIVGMVALLVFWFVRGRY